MHVYENRVNFFCHSRRIIAFIAVIVLRETDKPNTRSMPYEPNEKLEKEF